jgi:hypothetical protein
VIEDHQFEIEAEKEIGKMAIILWRIVKFFAFVIADGVVAGVSDQAAGEIGQAGGMKIAALGEQLGEIVEGVGGFGFFGSPGAGVNGRGAAGAFIDQGRGGGDEAVSGDAFAADDAFEQKGVVVAAKDFKGGDGGEMIA